MRPSFNEVTSMQSGTLEMDLQRCKEAGFKDMELREEKFYAYLKAGHTVSDVKALFEKYGIKPLCFNALRGFAFRHGQDMKTEKKYTELLCSALREIGIRDLEVIAAEDAPEGATEEEIHAETVRALKIIGEVAAEYGIRLALEYMGLKKNSVKTFNQALKIVKDTGMDNVGLLVDTWHHYMSGSTPEDILAGKDKIFVFHISDCPKAEPLSLERKVCWWPGDGEIPLDEIIKNLEAIGFDGAASVEVFDPVVQALPHEENVSTAYQKTCAALAKAGVLDAGYSF